MPKATFYHFSAGLGALLAGLSQPALAQQTGATTPDTTIVVTGVRASLINAQDRKASATQIVDSIVADDIGKLPDLNTTEALQRITGVQIERDYGEGSTVQVRGLSQVLSTLNGREVFTAQGTRGLNFQDVPAEMLSGIDVYKSPSANQIEGGLGGIIDLRTRRPFDFKGFTASVTAKGLYSDLASKVTPNVSGLISNRWNTEAGEFGALLAVSYQQRKFRSDLISTGTPTPRTDIVAGQTVIAPNGAYDVTPAGNRQRMGFDGMLQWRPNPTLEFYLEGHYANYKNINDNYGASVALSGVPVAPGSVQLNSIGDVVKATYLNAPVSVLSYAYDTHDKDYQFAGGGKWTHDRLTLNADVSYTKSTGSAIFNGAFTNFTIPRFTQDLTAFVPASNANGYDMLSQANTTFGFLYYSGSDFQADQLAARIDGSRKFDAGFLNSIDFGARFADRTAQSVQSTFFLYSGAPASSVSSLLAPNPANDFFSAAAPNVPQLGNYLTVPVPLLRNSMSMVQSTLGFTNTAPTPGPLTFYHVGEKTSTLYAMASFGKGTLVDGNVGLRYIHTQESLTGNQTTTSGAIAPIAVNTSYDNLLPSLNLRVNLTGNLKLRLAASKAITRPDFSQLSPTLTLNPVQLNGSAGNPNLRPMKADQFDASLEYYFSKKGSVYGAFFYKKVKDFISTSSFLESYSGTTYTITRPVNNQGGTVKGLELGYQQFFDFLPGALSGLGMQANYTFVDSATTTSIVGQVTPLQGLSKNSYNLVGIYEKYGISARVAYNWRSTYFDSTYPIGGAVQPSYRRGYGWLDASLSYDVTPRVTLMVEGSNLTRALRRSFYNNLDSRPHETQIDDRQILFGVRVKI